MSELEKEEIIARAKGMSSEEQTLTAMAFTDEVLLLEFLGRYFEQKEKLDEIRKVLPPASKQD